MVYSSFILRMQCIGKLAPVITTCIDEEQTERRRHFSIKQLMMRQVFERRTIRLIEISSCVWVISAQLRMVLEPVQQTVFVGVSVDH